MGNVESISIPPEIMTKFRVLAKGLPREINNASKLFRALVKLTFEEIDKKNKVFVNRLVKLNRGR